jgi:ligand-binding sensor domain-containing protein
MLRLLLFSLLLFNPVVLCSQSSPVFRHYGPEEGFPSGQVYQVISDNSGVLWFASDQGLVSYNGYEFRTWSTREGLTDNTVFKLQTDQDGVLWMQTFSGELFSLRSNRIYPYRFNHIIKEYASGKVPQSFYMDSRGTLYFISSAMQEIKIDADGNASVVSAFGKIKANGWIALHEVDTGKFVSSGNSVIPLYHQLFLLYTSPEGKIDTLEVPHKENNRLSAARLRDGTLLICVGFYLYRYDKGKLIECSRMPLLSNFLFEHSDNSIWLAAFNGVIHFPDGLRQLNEDTYLSDAFVTGFCQDFEGTLWITTLNEGIFSLSSTIAKQISYDKSAFKEPLSLTAGNNKVFASFWNGYVVEVSNAEILPIRKFNSSDFVSTVYFDSLSGRLYVAKANPGYLKGDDFFPLSANKGLALKGRFLPIDDQRLLNPTATGLYWIGPEGIFKKIPFPFRLNDIGYGPDSMLLFAASDGIYHFDQESGIFNVQIPELTGKRVQTFGFHEEVLVVAVRGEGLWLKKKNTWHRLTSANGLCSDFINKITFYRNKCWCSSSNGVSRFDLSEVGNPDINIENFNNSNYLPENQINDILIWNDTLWLASKNTISFFPASLSPVITVPPVVMLSGIKVNNRQIALSSQLRMDADENNLSVSFIGLSPSSNGKMYYRYQLISDRDTFESFTTNRQVDFPALSDGKYIFRVYARNVHYVWCVAPAGFEFVVDPPFWKRWWVIGLMIVVVVTGVYLILKFRLQKVRREQEWKSDLERQLLVLESKALRAQMNPHFIFNVMNSIQDFILKSDIKSAQKYLTKFARLVRMILDNSLLPEVLLEEELKANRLYVELEQQRFHQKFDFVFEMDDDLEESGIRIPSMLIQPFLENAIKHGISHLEGTGRLRLSVKRKNEDLVVEVEDNGVGRKAAAEWNALHQKGHQSMGSMLTEKRVEILNATLHTGIHLEVIDLLSDDGKPAGTLIRMIFPAVAAHVV